MGITQYRRVNKWVQSLMVGFLTQSSCEVKQDLKWIRSRLAIEVMRLVSDLKSSI